MSNGETTVSDPKKTRFAYKDQVIVVETGKVGVVLRRKDDQYTVKLVDGSRVYLPYTALKLVEPVEENRE